MKYLIMRKFLTYTIIFMFLAAPGISQESSLKYFVQLNSISTDGDNTPYWLTANRQGLTSAERNCYYGRYGVD